MIFHPYMGMMGGGFPGMGGAGPYNPMMSMMGGQNPMMSGMAGGQTGSGIGADGQLKPFDAGEMKRGRMGHYGYLEGRGGWQIGIIHPLLLPSCWSWASLLIG